MLEFNLRGYAEDLDTFTVPCRMSNAVLGQHKVAMGLNGLPFTLVHLVRGQIVQRAMTMLGVVPRHKPLAECKCLFQAPEIFRISKAAFEGREQAFRERIVIAVVRTTKALYYSQAFHQKAHGSMFHGLSIILMQHQSRKRNRLILKGFGKHLP